MTDELDLGSAADWLAIMREFDKPAQRIPARTLLDVARVASEGPESSDEAQRFVNDADLSRLLRNAWEDEPPSAELWATLVAGPGQLLLDLAPPASGEPESALVVELRPRIRWLAEPVRLDVPPPLAHAAAGDALPVVFRHSYDVGITLEVLGDTEPRTMTFTSARDEDCLIAFWVDEYIENRPTFVLPLIGGARSASVRGSYPSESGSRLGLLAGPDDLLAEPGLLEIVPKSVRASDGVTLNAWDSLALSLDPGSPLRAAIEAGLS